MSVHCPVFWFFKKETSPQTSSTENSKFSVSILREVYSVHTNHAASAQPRSDSFTMYSEPSEIVTFSNLRAQLKSNKIFNVVINSFTLFNCRPAIKNKDCITRQMRLLPKKLKDIQIAVTLRSNTDVKKQMELRLLYFGSHCITAWD